MIQILDFLTGRNQELNDLELELRESLVDEAVETRRRHGQEFRSEVRTCSIVLNIIIVLWHSTFALQLFFFLQRLLHSHSSRLSRARHRRIVNALKSVQAKLEDKKWRRIKTAEFAKLSVHNPPVESFAQQLT